MKNDKKYQIIVIGASAGGLYALLFLLEKLPVNYPIPIVVVQHRGNDQREMLEDLLQTKCKITVKQADEKEKIQNGCVYIAPPGYHLLIENDCTFSLTCDEQGYSRPSIDALFESAAVVFKNTLVGIILTGANNDGTSGITIIKEYGGLTIAQNPDEAQFSTMPKASIESKKIVFVWTLSEIQNFLLTLID